jgi:predicted RND superfamily exporter protein
LLSLYKSYTEVQRGFELSMQVNEGSVPLFLYIEHTENPLQPTQAADFTELKDALMQSGHVAKIIDAYTLISFLYGEMRGIEPQYPTEINQVSTIYGIVSGRADNPLKHFIDPDTLRSRKINFPADLQNNTLDSIQTITEKFAQNHDRYSISPTGAQYLFRELNQSMIIGQTTSILLAFIIIFVLLLLSLRDLRASFIALLPIAITVITLYGAMGLTGLSLNLITTTIFGITIGVGIDYAIHFTFIWTSFMKKGSSSEEAVKNAINYTARPIVTNGFGISIGLSALLFSPLLVHLYVAEMMWISMMVSMMLSLTFLPTLLRKIR